MTAESTSSPHAALSPDVAVLLCSYRGERFIAHQLDSIAAQSHPVVVFVHDDASDDRTVEIARRHPIGATVIAHADNVGIVRNVERGLSALLTTGHAHVALADQDDAWQPDRIAACLTRMREMEHRRGVDTPMLVHSDLRMVDASGAELAASFLRFRGYATSARRSLPIMLGQCGVMGNTCLVNRALMTMSLPFPDGLHVHDWWLGLLAELYGARGFVDTALVDYRIHDTNVSNSVDKLDGGAGAPSLARLLRRDFRLPFLEDSRRTVLDALLAGDGHRPMPRGADRATLERFIDYLTFPSARIDAIAGLLRGGYARPGRRHRLRLIAAALTSARYDARASRRIARPSGD